VRILRGIAGLLVALLVAGALYQWLAARADREIHPAPGRFVEVDGLRLHVDCRGEGRPTVLLEAGLTSGSASWLLVHDAVARVTRTCAYDRPGMDWSQPLGRTADATEVAARLHRLVQVAEIPEPYVLVGMSAGGVYVREYRRNHPDSIVGMVLVDSSHEQQGNRLPEISGAANIDRMLSLCSWLQPVGLIRAIDALDVLVDAYELTEEHRELIRANVYQSHACAAMLDESRSFHGEVYDADPPASLGELPLVVLSQGKEPAAIEAFGLSAETTRGQRAVWDVLQEELTALSTRGQRRVATESGHVIQLEQPQLVIDAIVGMVRDLRENRP
jgi:pimeloyl-ACP methyl ester carboxylesterase